MTRIVLVGVWDSVFLTVARSCARQGVEAYFLELGERRSLWRWYSSSLAGGSCTEAEGIDAIRDIRDYSAAVKAQGIVSCDERRLLWLAENREQLEGECKLLASSLETLNFLYSKRSQIKLAAQVGFSLLPTVYMFSRSDAAAIPANLYPVTIRPDTNGN